MLNSRTLGLPLLGAGAATCEATYEVSAYDAFGRLASVQSDGFIAEYAYTPSGWDNRLGRYNDVCRVFFFSNLDAHNALMTRIRQ